MIPTDLKRQHLDNLLTSDVFQRSAKLSRLLRRLVEPALDGRPHPIKEQILGIEVFERPADWDPQTDSIVRVHVKRLRQTLSLYYAEQKTPPPIRFEIPKGSYQARCVFTSAVEPCYVTASRTRSGGNPSLPNPAHLTRVSHIRLQRLTYERGDLTNAAFCPDGESIVYSARWRGEPVTIYSQRLGQKHSRPLGIPSGNLRDVSANGQLLFTLGEGPVGLLAQAELSGGPSREIVDGVADAVWLPDNKNIAAARLDAGLMRLELPLGNPIHYLPGNQTDIRLRVDETGQRVAFLDRSLGHVDFCLTEAGKTVERVSEGWRMSGGILWLSPERLMLSGARRGAAAVYSLDLTGAEESIYPTPSVWNLYDRTPSGRILASCVDSRLHIAFRAPSMHCETHLDRLFNMKLVGLTSDAKFAVLVDLLSQGAERNSPILLVALPDGEPVQIAEGYRPHLSSDGKTVISLEDTHSGTEIVATPIPRGLPRRYPLDGSRQYHSAECGGKLDRFLVHSFNDLGGLDSHLFDAQSGELSAIPGKQFLRLVAPNTEWGVIPGGSELRIAHLETGEIRTICNLNRGWSPVRWSSAGNELFVFEPGHDFATANVSRISVQTGEQTLWLTLRPVDNVGAYVSTWLDVTPDGRSYAYTYQQDLSDLYILDGLS